MADAVSLPEMTVEGGAPVPEQAPLQGIAPAPGMFAIKEADGSVSMVKQEDAEAAVAAGAEPATDIDIAQQDWRGGLAGQAASALIGAGRGLTFGAFDPLAIGVSRALGGDASAEDTRRALRTAKEVNPTASLGGEIAGSLAGMAVLPGGAGGSTLGAESTLGRAAARFATAAPRAGIEGAALGVGQQASEDALGDHAFNGEKYVAAGVGGAVFGVLLGGALSAAGGAVGDKLRPLYGKIGSEAEAVAGGPYRAAGKTAEAVEEAAQRSPARQWLADQAEQQAFKATGAKLKDFQKLGATAEAQAARSGRIGRTLLDEGIVDATASQETIAQRLAAKTKQVGEELGAMRAKLDTALERPSTAAIVERVQKEVLAPLERLPGTQTESAAVRAYLDDFAVKAGERPDFKTLHEFRRALDEKLNPKLWLKVPGTAPPAAVELGKVRGILEEEFETAGERAAKELGDTFGEKYQLAKQLFSDLKTAENIVSKEVARGNANRAISITDTIAASHGGVTGMAMGAANKLVRTYGNQVAASLLNKASRLGMLQRAGESVDGAIKSGVRDFLTGKPAGKAPAAPKVDAETVRAVREAVRDPAALTQRVTDALGGRGLTEAAPKTTQAVASTIMRLAGHIRESAPKEPPQTGVSFLPKPAREPSKTDMARFAQVIEAADNPMSVVEDLRRGKLTPEKVATLKVGYPRLYQAIRRELATQAAELRPKLNTQQEIALSILFDVPVSAMMEPGTILSFQKTIAQGAEPPQAAQAGQPKTAVRGLNRRGSLAAGFDKQEAPT